MKKLLLPVLVLGTLAGCNADDIQNAAESKAGVDIYDSSAIKASAKAFALGLEVISQAALECGTDSNCEVDASYANGSIEGTLKVSGDVSKYTVTSEGALKIKSDDGKQSFKVSLFAHGNSLVLTQDINNGALYAVELTDSHFEVSKPEDAMFGGKTLIPFEFNFTTTELTPNAGKGEISGENKDTRTFTYTNDGNIKLD